MANFGFSISDFLAALELANNIRKRFNNAPSQFKHISQEVRTLSIILQDVSVTLSGRELDAQQQASLEQISESCSRVLDDLENILDKYNVLENCDGSLNKRVKKVWKRLSFEPDDICQIRHRITSNITILHTFLGRISSRNISDIREAVNKLNGLQADQERCQILNWLTTVDYSIQQADYIALQQAGTGQWFLDSIEYRNWLQASKATLFCPGIPGAGKTICTAIVVDDLTYRFENQQDIGVAYLYCNFNRRYEQKAKQLLINLLKQLSLTYPSLPDCVKALHERYKRRKGHLSIEDVSDALQSVVSMYSKVFIVVDALDECDTFDGSQGKLVTEILKLQTNSMTNVLATSRFTEIAECFRNTTTIRIHASETDVRTYIDKNMFRLPGFVHRNPELQDEIRTAILARVDGMFLLAKLHFESLIGKKSPKSVRSALSTLPTGKAEYLYDRAYERAMDRIEGQADDLKLIAKKALSWIIFAKRPLTSVELRHALAIEEWQPTFDKENLSDIEDIVSGCAGLVTVDMESHIVRLVHYTTQEYFDRTRGRWFPDAEKDITTACITYLSLDDFSSGYCETTEEFKERMYSNPFYAYATQMWGNHAKNSSNVYDHVLNFLQDVSKVDASSQALMVLAAGQTFLGYKTIDDPLDPEWDDTEPRETKIVGLHLAAYFGLQQVVSDLAENSPTVNVSDDWGHTPLIFAAGQGHDDIIQFLLDKGADIEVKDAYDGRTALSWAIEKGHSSSAQLLLDRNANVNSLDVFAKTPLHLATKEGNISIVQRLLDKGADTNLTYKMGKTALHVASKYGHQHIVQLLIGKNVDINSKTESGQTALCIASERGHKDIVQLLLDEKADTSIEVWGTALLAASYSGNWETVELLVDRGPEITAPGWEIEDALLSATTAGRHDIVERLLIKAGIDHMYKSTLIYSASSRRIRRITEASVALMDLLPQLIRL